jgi:hypothetical protein
VDLEEDSEEDSEEDLEVDLEVDLKEAIVISASKQQSRTRICTAVEKEILCLLEGGLLVN